MSKPGDIDPASCLMPEDITVDCHDSPSMVCLHLKGSKTDPFQHGVDIYLGRTDADLCLITALLAFMVVRPARQGPLFIYNSGLPLTRVKLVAAVRQALEQAGVQSA